MAFQLRNVRSRQLASSETAFASCKMVTGGNLSIHFPKHLKKVPKPNK
jgi:hypothetical protein